MLHRNLETSVVHAGRGERYPGAPLNLPVSFSSTYVAGTERVYARKTQVNTVALETALGVLESGEALVFSSGMAAVAAAIDSVIQRTGRAPRILAPDDLYAGTLGQLRERSRRGEIVLRVYTADDGEDLKSLVSGYDLVWIESPSNPLLRVYDIQELADECHRSGALLCVDSTFATPIIQNPLTLGADMVVHSASKYIGGHSDLLAGVAITADSSLARLLEGHRTLYGSVIGPMEAFLALRGLRTLAIRIERASSNALHLATMLEAHPAVIGVNYPYLNSSPYRDLARAQMSLGGAMVSFELPGSPYEVERFCDSLRIAVNSTSLGGVETQAERRARHGGESVSPGLVRVSVGIENRGDINSDFEQALEKVYGPF